MNWYEPKLISYFSADNTPKYHIWLKSLQWYWKWKHNVTSLLCVDFIHIMHKNLQKVHKQSHNILVYSFTQYKDHTNTRRITSCIVCVPHTDFTKFSFISKYHSTRWYLPPILGKYVSVFACPSAVVEPHLFGNDLIRQRVSSFQLVYSEKFDPTWWIISPSSISEGSSQCLGIQHFVVVIPNGKHNVNQLHITWHSTCA
jgi:hypothetical protein